MVIFGYPKSLCLTNYHRDLFLFSSTCFMALKFYLEIYDLCKLNSVYGQDLSQGLFLSFLHINIQLFQYHLLKRLSLFHWVIWAPLLKNLLPICMWSISGLYSVLLIYMSIFMTMSHNLCRIGINYRGIIVGLKIIQCVLQLCFPFSKLFELFKFLYIST